MRLRRVIPAMVLATAFFWCLIHFDPPLPAWAGTMIVVGTFVFWGWLLWEVRREP